MAENSSINSEDSEKTAKVSEENKIASNTDEQPEGNELEDKWLASILFIVYRLIISS